MQRLYHNAIGLAGQRLYHNVIGLAGRRLYRGEARQDHRLAEGHLLLRTLATFHPVVQALLATRTGGVQRAF